MSKKMQGLFRTLLHYSGFTLKGGIGSDSKWLRVFFMETRSGANGEFGSPRHYLLPWDIELVIV